MRTWRPQTRFANGAGTFGDTPGKGKPRIPTSGPVCSPPHGIESDAGFMNTVKLHVSLRLLGVTSFDSLSNRRLFLTHLSRAVFVGLARVGALIIFPFYIDQVARALYIILCLREFPIKCYPIKRIENPFFFFLNSTQFHRSAGPFHDEARRQVRSSRCVYNPSGKLSLERSLPKTQQGILPHTITVN